MLFLKRLWQQRNYRSASIIALLAMMWLLSRVFFDHLSIKTAGGQQAVEDKQPLWVQARRLQAEPYTIQTSVNGRTEPNRSVQLRVELDGVVVALPVIEGEVVKPGDVICELEAEDRPQALARAQAALKKAELDYTGAQELKARGLQANTELAQQWVLLANARADLKRAQVEVENLKVRAPFAGLINHRALELGDFVRRGEVCATLLDMNPMLLVGEVSESQVAQLAPGDLALARLQQGDLVQGQLRFISQQADDITRGYRVEVALDNSFSHLRGGSSARLMLPGETVSAHFISASLLTLDDAGDLGVRIVDDEQRVRFINVQLLSDVGSGVTQSEGVWVQGLPTQVTLITVGQEYASIGEQVQVDLQIEEGLQSPVQSVLSSGVAPSASTTAVYSGSKRENP